MEDSFAAPPADIWSRWLLSERHGGASDQESRVQHSVNLIRDKVLAGVNLKPGSTLIDVGSGTGLVALEAFARLGGNLDAILYDVSAAALFVAEKALLKLGVRDRCSFIIGSAHDMHRVNPATVDIATSRAALAYIADKHAAIAEIFRVLRPGGTVSIAEPINRWNALRLAGMLAALPGTASEVRSVEYLVLTLQSHQIPSDASTIDENPLTNFSERQLLQWFEEAGFRNIHMELHTDVKTSPPLAWDTFLNCARFPGVASSEKLLRQHFSKQEATKVETVLRPLVESGGLLERTATAYLTAHKPF